MQAGKPVMTFDRRRALVLAASAVSLPSLGAAALASEGLQGVQRAVDGFAGLPGTTSCLVAADRTTDPWQVAHDPAARVFVGSAVKTFILAQYLRDVESGRLTEEQQFAIDDGVRSVSSSVFLHLTGTTPGRNVLEAMIAHSDNTATDVALAAVSPTRVRELVAEAGLVATQIPDSTRRLFSYVAGAPEGVDLGWDGLKRVLDGASAGATRPPLNDHETMASTSEDLVDWYRQALRGAFFAKPATLVEFKRIQSMADALWYVVPADTAAYGKGGSIDWGGFHCFSLAGQMIVGGKTPVTFCFTVNWNGPDDGVAAVLESYKTTVGAVLHEAAQAAI